ncbi:MAG: ArnT family glycosyltransferase [Polyangiales bacterium]
MSSHGRRWIAAIGAVLVFCALAILVRRNSSITDDWMGWRQADTLAIARNLAFVEPNLLRPRIDWGGDGPGYVESELQLYTAIVAAAFRVFGESVWAGQLLSLFCCAVTGLVLFDGLRRRFGELPAWIGLVASLFGQGLVVASTSIQPDPLALLAFTIGFFAFLRWVEEPSSRHAIVWVAATAIAGLVKPTTLELGIAQGVLILLAHRRRLSDPRLWIGWATVLVVVAVHLLHARGLHRQYGNTFGVLSGGDSKLPNVARLLEPSRWIELARIEIRWGIGILGVLSAGFLLVRRAVVAEEVALAAGALALDVVAFRYTSGKFGTHYHLPHVVLGAFLGAHAAAELQKIARARTLVAIALIAGSLGFVGAIRFLRAQPPEPETALGRALATIATPGTLVAVRARAPAYDAEWHTANNYQDPRVFYLSRTHGWAVPRDERGAVRLAQWAARGARFYVHVGDPPDADLAAWLAAHGELVARTEGGTIHRISP